MTKKLFVVEIVYEAYAWAEDDAEACDMYSEIARTENFPRVSAVLARWGTTTPTETP